MQCCATYHCHLHKVFDSVFDIFIMASVSTGQINPFGPKGHHLWTRWRNSNLYGILKLLGKLSFISCLEKENKASFKRCATAMPNSFDRFKFDFSTAFETKSSYCLWCYTTWFGQCFVFGNSYFIRVN